MLYGFSGVILQGAIVTLELALSSVVLAVLIGLVGAGAKLSQNRVTGLIFDGRASAEQVAPDGRAEKNRSRHEKAGRRSAT